MIASLAIGSAVAGLIGTFANLMSNRNNNKLNKKLTESTNAQNQANFDKQFEYMMMQDKRDFEYTQLLNQQSQSNFENQFSIAAKDAANAGINPLALNGASAGSASFQGSSAASMPGAPNLQTPRMVAGDYSQLGSVLDSLLSYTIQEKSLKQNKEIAEDQLEVQRYNAETTRKQSEAAAITNDYNAHKNPVDTVVNGINSLADFVRGITGTTPSTIQSAMNKIIQTPAERLFSDPNNERTVEKMLDIIEQVPPEDRKAIFGDAEINLQKQELQEKVSWWKRRQLKRAERTAKNLESLKEREAKYRPYK